MYSGLGTCFVLLVVGHLCSAASIPISTELPPSSYTDVMKHFRKVFLDFPCSNKVVVNQLFDVYSKFGDLDQNQNAIEDAVSEMKRLIVVGSDLNVSPAAWKTAQQNYESRAEQSLDSFVAELKLAPAQIERLQIIYPMDRPYGELQLYEDNFPLGIALGIPEEGIKQILEHHLSSITDFQSRIVISKIVSEEMGDFAEEKCLRKYVNPGHYTKKANIVRDFLQAIDALKNDDDR